MKISIRLIENNNEFIATCPELDINCYGSDRIEAVRRIKNVIHFYINSARELGLDVETLNEIMLEGDSFPLTLEQSFNQSSETIN